jgi:hypothetical protein
MGRRKRRAQAKKQTKNQQPQAASELRESARKAPTQRRSLPALLQKEWCQISLVFGVALLLRVLNILFMRESSPFYDMPATDSALYDAVAKTLAKGNWLGDEVFYYNPFYPYFLGLLYALFGESYTVVKVIQAFIGSASAVLVFVIAKRLFDRPVALIAGGIAAAYGVFIFYDELLLAATVSISLLLLAMHLLLRAGERPSIRRFSAAGFLVGLAFLSRPTVFPLVAVLWVIYRLRKERVSFIAVRLAVLGTAAALMIAPVTIRNYAVGDDLVLISSHTGSNIYLGNHEDSNGYFVLPRSMPRTLIDNPTDVRDYFKKMAEEDIGRELKPSEVSQYWSAKGFEYISSHPVDWLKLAGQKLMRLVNEYESSDNQSYYFTGADPAALRLRIRPAAGPSRHDPRVQATGAPRPSLPLCRRLLREPRPLLCHLEIQDADGALPHHVRRLCRSVADRKAPRATVRAVSQGRGAARPFHRRGVH